MFANNPHISQRVIYVSESNRCYEEQSCVKHENFVPLPLDNLSRAACDLTLMWNDPKLETIRTRSYMVQDRRENRPLVGCSALIRISMHCVRIVAQTMTANVSLTISIDRAQSRPLLLDRFARLQISSATPRKSSLCPMSKSITCPPQRRIYTLYVGTPR